MRTRPLALLLLWSLPLAPALAQGPDEHIKIERDLVHLSLGDTLDDIEQVFPTASEWPITVEPRTKVKRYRVDRAATKYPAPHADVMWLGLKHGRLVEIQLIYTKAYTHSKSADALARDLALTYGEPHFNGSKYWWTDGRTALRVFDAEVPPKDGGPGVELRTSLQLLEAKLLRKQD